MSPRCRLVSPATSPRVASVSLRVAGDGHSLLKTITEVLEPARIATEGLSNASLNLLVGEGILKFLVTEMDRLNLEFGSGSLSEKFQLAFYKKTSRTARLKSEQLNYVPRESLQKRSSV